MGKISFLEKMLMIFNNDYIILEIWSQTYKSDKLKQYTTEVLNQLKNNHPEIEILSEKKSKYVETRNCPYISFPGYVIKITPNIDTLVLKKSCIELEKDKSGSRISDIDVYYKNWKISRKDMAL